MKEEGPISKSDSLRQYGIGNCCLPAKNKKILSDHDRRLFLNSDVLKLGSGYDAAKIWANGKRVANTVCIFDRSKQ